MPGAIRWISTGAAGSRCFSDPQSLKVGPCAAYSLKSCFRVFFLAGLATACADSSAVTVAEDPSGILSCQLSVSSPVQQGHPVNVELVLHNGLTVPVRVLRYFTPFEGIMGEIFDIHRQGQPLLYEGPMVKRAAPGEEDWLLLNAGEALSATVDIAGAWNLAQPGEYRLQLRDGIRYRVAGEPEPRQLDPASCGTVDFAVSGKSG